MNKVVLIRLDHIDIVRVFECFFIRLIAVNIKVCTPIIIKRRVPGLNRTCSFVSKG